MDEQIKAKWVKALRSGKYEQCIGYYELAGKHCCLGVLGKVMKVQNYGTDFETEAGLSSVIWELTDLNDSGATFEQIALCIENGL